MGKRWILFIGIAIGVFGLHSGSSAEHFQFVTFQFPPLEFSAEDGTAQGIAVEIVTHVMHALGHDVAITVYPWTRALKMVRKGQADAIFTAYKNAERERYLDYSNQVLFPQVVYFYKNRDSNIEFNGDMASLQQKRIGIVSTISYGLVFDQARSNFILDKAHKLEHNFQKLLMNRVDLVPSNIYVAEHTLRRLNLGDKIVRMPPKIESVPSYIAFSKKRHLTELRDQFDKQLASMKASGKYGTIITNYNITFIDTD